VELLPSGGISADNAAAFLAAGATAVCAGTSVVPPGVVAAGDWSAITERARAFAAALTPPSETPGATR
jgi:2-dehydro-3-deoxyphosphogluconate aldolase / (4S)-4-hydroxy-2-oxoglutarate aldolase